MNMLPDEILNKYIDGELSHAERLNVADQLEHSPEDRKRYQALLAVHMGLKKIVTMEVSPDFTSVFMARILKINKSKKDQKIFILSISSVFAVIGLVILGFLFSWLFSTYNTSISPYTTYIDDSISYLTERAQGLKLSGRNMSILGSVISLCVIISAYFFFDTLKHTKGKLSKIN